MSETIFITMPQAAGLLKPPPGHPHYKPEPTPEEKKMSTSPAQQKYAELRNKIVEAKKAMEATAKGIFTEMATELFNENPTLMSFRWEQYTPYYNDGDVCTFRCNGDYPTVSMIVDGDLWGYDSNRGDRTINGDKIESSDELIRKFENLGVDAFSKNGRNYTYDKKTKTVSIDGAKVLSYSEYAEQFKPLEKAVSTFMRNFANEDMETIFGDHARVTVKRDGTIDVEEYEHD